MEVTSSPDIKNGSTISRTDMREAGVKGNGYVIKCNIVPVLIYTGPLTTE
jgi:hypothetical protein